MKIALKALALTAIAALSVLFVTVMVLATKMILWAIFGAKE